MAFAKSWRDFFVKRPCFVMFLAVALQVVVPALARIDGNLDYHQNSMFHIFGSSSICVAMDFPGWAQAATVCFFLGGCANCWALLQIFGRYNRYSNRSEEKKWSASLTVFAAFELMCFFSLFMVGLFNPVNGHDDVWVMFHALPYITLRLGYFLLFIWMNVWYPPKPEWRHVVKFRVCSILCAIVATGAQAYTILGYGVLVPNNADTIAKQAALAGEFLAERYPLLRVTEIAAVVLAVLTLLAHPLGPTGRPDMLPEASDVEGVPEASSRCPEEKAADGGALETMESEV